MPSAAPTLNALDLLLMKLSAIGVPTLATYSGPGVAASALLLLLIGFVFGRRWLRGLGVVLWLVVITVVVVFSIFIMGDAARTPYNWGWASLMAGLGCFLAAGEWALRRLKAR